MRLAGARISLAVLTAAALAAAAPSSHAAPGSVGHDAVSVRPVPAVTLHRGKADTAHVTVTVKDGYHVQANPASDTYLIPTTLQVKARAGITAGKPRYPRGRAYQLKGSTDNISIYDGTFEIAVPVRAGRTASHGQKMLKATLRFQACDDKACFAPTTLPVEIEVVVPGTARPATP
jgi:hypothetical protein